MSDLVAPILEIIKFVGRPVGRYLNYQRKFKDYVDDLKQAQKDLQARMDGVQQQLQDEESFGKKPKLDVENWFQKVEKKLSHAQHVEHEVSNGSYLCRSCMGKHVHETTLAINVVYNEGNFSGSLVVKDPSTSKIKLLTEELVGTTKADEVYRYLMGDEVRMIGVCGMGGIGKTTIMMHVYNRLLEKKKFSKLLWTTVSKHLDIRRLQKSIASQLGEKLSDDDDTTRRAALLSEMLKKRGSYVLILDDVWSSFSLKDVGILEPTKDNGCKLVLTTRSERVVRSMGCTKVQMTILSRDEALQLFLSKVGQDMLSIPTLESIVAECDGLPLAIVTVAGCVKGIFDHLVWENALYELKGYIRNFRDVEDMVFACLKFSYDHLPEIDRHRFLYCALYPEDHGISEEMIIENWMHEGLIEGMGTIRAMICSGHSIIQKLEENCLLERVGDKGSRHIKMHNVVRDMALHITRKRFLVKAGKQLKEIPNDEEEWPEDLEKVSLMYNSISAIPSNLNFPKFEKITTLLLSHNELGEIPESFFDHMPNMKILDLSGNEHIVKLPNSISNLEKLTALLLRDCQCLDNLPSLLKLQALKKLDLRRTSIKEIPQGLGMLVSLRYLNLGFTKYLKELPNGLVSNLCRLQYLAIHPSPIRVKEMMQLNQLEVFEGCFSNMLDFVMYEGQRKRLYKHWIWVSHELSHHFFIEETMDCSKKVGFEGNSGNKIILPCDIQQLDLYKCKAMRSLNDICGWEDVTDLKECRIWECDEVECLFLSKCRQLETLESLHIVYLPNLKFMVGESSVARLSYLKKIFLYECGKIKNLFSTMWDLHNLEYINVARCKKIEEIIVSEEEEIGPSRFNYTFPKLKKLDLLDLPELKSICSENGVLVCDSLQSLKIENCTKLKRIPLSLAPLKQIRINPKEWWELVELDDPHAKDVLRPFLYFFDDSP